MLTLYIRLYFYKKNNRLQNCVLYDWLMIVIETFQLIIY